MDENENFSNNLTSKVGKNFLASGSDPWQDPKPPSIKCNC